MSNELETKIHPLDLEDNIAIGLKLPLVNSQNNFFGLNYTTQDQIKTNFYNFLLTNKGERLYLPTYGTDLRKLLFENPTPDFDSKIIDEITDGAQTWLPYITINDVNVTKEEHVIYIDIVYSINHNNVQDELNVAISL